MLAFACLFLTTDGTACGDSSSDQCDNPDTCLAGTCVPNFEPPTTPCDNGLFCDGADTCNGSGVCTGAGSPCQPGETCDEDNDTCDDCVIDEDCRDLLFCNGDETCVDGQCQPGVDPCPGQFCDEYDNVCVDEEPCTSDADCDDLLFCNGVETCDISSGECQPGTEPCPSCSVCDEDLDICSEVLVDLDIVKLTVSGSKDKRNKGKNKQGGSANVGKPIRRIQLTVENPSGKRCEQTAPATITGVQDGKEIYNETRMVWDLGSQASRYAFPNYTPIKKGTINWTAEIFDDDPDNDIATATTRVK